MAKVNKESVEKKVVEEKKEAPVVFKDLTKKEGFFKKLFSGKIIKNWYVLFNFILMVIICFGVSFLAFKVGFDIFGIIAFALSIVGVGLSAFLFVKDYIKPKKTVKKASPKKTTTNKTTKKGV